MFNSYIKFHYLKTKGLKQQIETKCKIPTEREGEK